MAGIELDKPLNRIEGIDYVFKHERLLTQALTHRSFGSPHYERLEFLGDGVLNLIAAEMLFKAHPHAPEGDLSRLRSRLVRDTTLAEIASDLDLGSHVRLGLGEKKSGGHLRTSIMADLVEALVGAVYLDGGFLEAHRVVAALLETRLKNLPPAAHLKDPKTRLQEVCQRHGQALPRYRIVEEKGADHAKEFLVECALNGQCSPTRARARSRREAEQMAAEQMLSQWSADHG